jgi:hypothetical protein
MRLPETKTMDMTHFPLVVLVVPPAVDGAYVEALGADTVSLLAMRAKYVTVSDTTAVAGMTDAKTRRRIGEWNKSLEAEFKRWQVANALYVVSGLVRAGLSAVHWFAPPPVPTVVETHLGAALDFVRGHAVLAGLDPTGIDAYARQRGVRVSGDRS